MAKVIITPLGGHGSSFIGSCLNSLTRPDVVFAGDNDWLDIYQFPSTRQQIKEWKKRTKTELHTNWTIEENLIRLITDHKGWIVLGGQCCTTRPFLTKNNLLKAICLIRHPRDAYISFYGHQHPEKAESHGGYDTKAAISAWANLWNRIMQDFLQSGSQICRFEDWPQCTKNKRLIKTFKNKWKKNKKNYNLSKENSQYLHSLVSSYSDRFYKWND